MAEQTGVILGADGKSIYDSPPKRNYQQIPLQAFSDWSTVGAVKQTLMELEIGGNFRMPSLLWDQMGRDDRIAGVFETRINSLNGLPFEFEPADDSAEAERVAADCKAQWPKMFPEATMNALRSWGLAVQLGIGELEWNDLGGKQWLPVLREWNPQYAYWRWDRWTYWMTTLDQGTVEMLPGEAGRWKWMLYCPAGAIRGWMKALVRSLAIPWLIRQWDWRDWARFNEVHGLPIRAGIVPAGSKEEHKQRFLAELAALGNETAIRLEQSEKEKFDLKLVEATSTQWETFEKLMGRADTAVAVRILGQNLTTEAGTSSSGGGGLGGKGMGQIHDRVRADFLRSDGVTFAETAREQVLEPWALFNYGSRSLAPRPVWKTDPPDDKDKKAAVLVQVGTGVTALRAAGMNVDLDQIAKDFSIPTKEGDPPKPDIPEGAPPGTSGKPQQGTPEFHPEGKRPKKGLQSARPKLKPHVHGQLFTDELGDHGVAAARAVLRKDLAKVLAAVEKAQNWVELRHLLAKAFEGMDPAGLASVQRAALALAELNGRHSVLEEM